MKEYKQPSLLDDDYVVPPKPQLEGTVNEHPEFVKILEQMLETHRKKGADYGSPADIFANVKSAEEFGIENYIGVCLRMNDKMQRIKQFALRGELKNESFEDALLDLASYSVIALVLYRERNNA